ncbi:DUF308 domain-containing protein [Microbacterium sp.]|uniref:DUF308 domain-containing protein n=1 Tax=Microbacterium sp. TaxID=51671 RepID=UPI0039E5B78C
MSETAARAFEVRHVQLARALLAALAAVTITFSPDHSAGVGLAVFSGFAIATGVVVLLAARVRPVAPRWPAVLLGSVTLVAGLIASFPGLRSIGLFFSLVIVWAVVSGVVEVVAGLVRRDEHTRDAVLIGVLTIVLGVALLFVSPGYALHYAIEEAGEFTLTGIAIAVGVFGGYAAVVAVFLAIAGFSPRRPAAGPDAATASVVGSGGAA